MELIQIFWAVPFLRFLVVGGINTLFGYSIFAILTLLKVHYALALLIGTVLGIIFNFNTTGRIVFKNSDVKRLLGFLMVYGVTYLVNLGCLRIFDLNRVNMLIAGAIMILPMAALSYILNKTFVFKTTLTR
jgi:putative flippase GtrA